MKLAITSFVALALGASVALAAGSSGGGGGSAAPPKPKMHKCGKGKVWNEAKGKCTKKMAELDDKELYNQGYALAKFGEYDWAIEVLSAIKNQNDPDVMNMLGYANRKAGRLELGISYYDKALEMKPDFVRAREYLGEGYVAAGKIELAKTQLAEIAKVCGTTCDEYKDLSKVIDNGGTL